MSFAPRCEQCDSTFAPLDGGICPACRRLLCGACLRGRWRSLLPRLQGGETCVQCRTAPPDASGARHDRSTTE